MMTNDMTTATTTKTPETVIRYWVLPAATRRGFFVKTVIRDADGKEQPGRQSWKFNTKAEAKAFKEARNLELTAEMA